MKENLQGVDPITNGEDHTNGGVNTKSSGDPAQSETPRTSRNIMHENRETWSASAAQFGGRPVGEGQGRTTYRHAGQESDSGVVPMKGSNKEGQPTAESLEGRPETKENDRQRHMRPTQCGTRMSQGLKGVRLGRLLALTPFIQGKSRMRETRSYGSVRGVPGDRHPYRDFNTARVRARSCFHPYAARIAETLLRVARDEQPIFQGLVHSSRRYLTRGHLLSVPAYLSPKRNTLELSRELKILEPNIHLLTQRLLDEANTAAAVLVEGDRPV